MKTMPDTLRTLALVADEQLQREAGRPGQMIGGGPGMQRLFALMERLTSSDATLLIQGETGVGKELVARTIHDRSRRAGGPFVVFDCASVPESLIAGELFGHVRGAFTGATRDHVGAFERAHGGTLFIDEIGELALELQPKLLRAIETRTVRRIGDRDELQLDVRILAATHRNVGLMVREQRFRADLLYRLAVVTLTIPPLRERREDLEGLIAHFANQLDPRPPSVPSDVLVQLRRHTWPGNLRELRNLVERAAALGTWHEDLHAPCLGGEDPASFSTTQSYHEAKEGALAAFERRFLSQLLLAHNGNLTRAARTAGMDRSHLSALVHKHGFK